MAAEGWTGAGLGAGLLIAGILAAAVPATAGSKTERVTLNVPLPARLDMGGLRRVLVTRFLVDQDLPDLDLNREVVLLLRRELGRKTQLDILDVEPPPLPEQPLADLLANNGFWRRMAETHHADLILSGKAGFTVADRSGYVEQDEISPLTGQRVRRTRFVEREGYTLDLNLFFFRGTTGRLLYEDHFKGENTFQGHTSDRLTVLFTIFDQIEDDVLGIVTPKSRTVQRYLFTE